MGMNIISYVPMDHKYLSNVHGINRPFEALIIASHATIEPARISHSHSPIDANMDMIISLSMKEESTCWQQFATINVTGQGSIVLYTRYINEHDFNLISLCLTSRIPIARSTHGSTYTRSHQLGSIRYIFDVHYH